MSINPRKFYKVDGILLEDENGENYPRIINQKAREKQSLEEFRREQNKRENRKSLKNVSYLIGKFVKTYTIFTMILKVIFLINLFLKF